jgi:metal-responsive CopG/Arc/MetJ family transcriptional regulator
MVKRGNTKGVISATIDKHLLEKFKKICKNNSINKSQLMQTFVEEYIKKNG